VEELPLLLGGAAHALHVVAIPDILLLRGLGLRGGGGLWSFRPGHLGGGRGQFLDLDVLGLDDGFAAGMDLEADPAVRRDSGVGLGVIQRRHAVDPGAEPATLGADAVLVPVAFLDRGLDGLGVGRVGDDLVAAALVVELAVPTRPEVHLITRHLGVVGDAHTLRICTPLFTKPVPVRRRLPRAVRSSGRLLFVARNEVARHVLRGRTAADLAGLDAPPGRVALPAVEGLAVKQGDRRGGGDQGETEEQGGEEAGTHGRGLPP
jgi:hypothetical protein